MQWEESINVVFQSISKETVEWDEYHDYALQMHCIVIHQLLNFVCVTIVLMVTVNHKVTSKHCDDWHQIFKYRFSICHGIKIGHVNKFIQYTQCKQCMQKVLRWSWSHIQKQLWKRWIDIDVAINIKYNIWKHTYHDHVVLCINWLWCKLWCK